VDWLKKSTKFDM